MEKKGKKSAEKIRKGCAAAACLSSEPSPSFCAVHQNHCRRRRRIATPLSGVQQVKAPKSGLILWKCDIGDTVKKGEVLAELLDPMVDDAKKARLPVVAETTGQFIARRRDKLARAGDVIGKLAGAETLPGKEKGLLLQD